MKPAPIVVLLSVLAGASVFAQAPYATPAEVPATLTFGNRTIAIFRANLASRPPASRVRSAETLLASLVEGGVFGPVGTQPFQEGTVVTLGGQNVFILVPQDADDLAGETLASISGRAASQLTIAIGEAVELRRPTVLLRGALLAGLATVVAALLLWLLLAGYRRATAALVGAIERQLEHYKLNTASTPRVTPVLEVLRWGVRAVTLVLGLLIGYFWLTYTLNRFPYTRPWGEGLRRFLLERLGLLGMRLLHALPGLFTVVVIVLATRFAIYCLGLVFDAAERKQIALPLLDPDLVRPTQRIVNALAWVFCIVMAFPFVPGSNTDAFKGVTVFVGLILSLGSSGLVNQVMSGFVITYSRSIRPGEFACCGDVEGTVVKIGILATTVRTQRGEEVHVPNAIVISHVVTNYSRPGRRSGVWVSTAVTIGYDTPWRQVHALLLEAAARTDGIVNDPPPTVRQTGLQDFYVEYTLLVGPKEPRRRGALLSELHAHIQDLFNEHGVQIMSPHYESDPQGLKIVPKPQWYAPPARRREPIDHDALPLSRDIDPVV